MNINHALIYSLGYPKSSAPLVTDSVNQAKDTVLPKDSVESSENPPQSPAAILHISPTSILISSGGNLYHSNASWNKVP